MLVLIKLHIFIYYIVESQERQNGESASLRLEVARIGPWVSNYFGTLSGRYYIAMQSIIKADLRPVQSSPDHAS